MREVEVGLCFVNAVEALELVRDTFDVETALVPGKEDAAYASLSNCVTQVTSSPSWCTGLALVRVGVGAGVGVGVGVGVGDVRVVWGGIVDELMNEELLMGSVESETV